MGNGRSAVGQRDPALRRAPLGYAPAMTLVEDFESAQQRVKAVTSLGNDTLLELYGLFKQSTVGDVEGKRPGMLDIKGRAKYDAWSSRRTMSRDAAMKAYIALVDRLTKK